MAPECGRIALGRKKHKVAGNGAGFPDSRGGTMLRDAAPAAARLKKSLFRAKLAPAGLIRSNALCGERRMKKRVYVWLAVMATLLGLMTHLFLKAGGDEDRGPRYTLAAFKRQWNVHSTNPKARIKTPHKVEDGYAVDYGDGVSMLLFMHEDTVKKVRIRYELGTDEGSGGPRFLLLVHTAINVGTFRWPPERINQVRQIFSLSLLPKSYRYLYTTFTRTHDQPDRWDFVMDFVPNKAEENSEAPASS
jgi:hypothetical protein